MPFSDLQLGTDIVAIHRIRQGYARFGVRYFERLLTADELAYCQSGTENNLELFLKRAAGRIALKEAVSKALNVGLIGMGYSDGVPWQSIEVASRTGKPPELLLHGKAEDNAREQNIQAWRISLSHDGDSAVATAIALIQEPSGSS